MLVASPSSDSCQSELGSFDPPPVRLPKASLLQVVGAMYGKAATCKLPTVTGFSAKDQGGSIEKEDPFKKLLESNKATPTRFGIKEAGLRQEEPTRPKKAGPILHFSGFHER